MITIVMAMVIGRHQKHVEQYFPYTRKSAAFGRVFPGAHARGDD